MFWKCKLDKHEWRTLVAWHAISEQFFRIIFIALIELKIRLENVLGKIIFRDMLTDY